MSQIIIGLITEGSTDIRLLESIVERTFVDVGFECDTQIEVITPIINIEKGKGDFISQIENCCRRAFEVGVMALCVHADADDISDNNVFVSKVNPAITAIVALEGDFCKILVPVIPVQMSECWMLADKQLLKDEIGTDMSDAELGINRRPESISDPKAVIENAIRIARKDMVKHRRQELPVSELYQPIGQKIELGKLESLPSYLKFKEAVRNAYRSLNYLR
jgi:hypothetical protein